MSNAVSALNEASFEGFAKVSEMGLQGMITLRGDFKAAKFKKGIKDVAGVAVPGQREVATKGDTTLAWMSSDELLLLVPYANVNATVDALEKALKGTHFLAVNVSDARGLFRVSGAGARDAIAKLSPVDMSTDAFGPGQLRRTRMAQVPAAIWMPDDTSVQIICFRSVAQYVFDLLKGATAPGSEVGHLG